MENIRLLILNFRLDIYFQTVVVMLLTVKLP